MPRKSVVGAVNGQGSIATWCGGRCRCTGRGKSASFLLLRCADPALVHADSATKTQIHRSLGESGVRASGVHQESSQSSNVGRVVRGGMVFGGGF